MVDDLINRGLDESPATDWTVMVSDEVALLLPRESDVLSRPIGQQPGYYGPNVYRDQEVVSFPMRTPIAILSDSTGLARSLYLNLVTGVIGRTTDEVGLPGN